MIEILRKIWVLLDKKEQYQAVWLFGAVVIMAIFETIGVASIFPFIAVLSEPQVIHSNEYLNKIFYLFGKPDERQFLFYLGLGVLVVLTTSNAFSAFTMWLLFRYSCMRENTISKHLLSIYLQKPYYFYLNRNTSELVKNLHSEVYRVAMGIFIPSVQTIGRLASAVFIIILLIIIDPFIAIVVSVVLIFAYVGVYYLVRHKLGIVGAEQSHFSALRYKTAGEAMNGIKDIKILGAENNFIKSYSNYSYKFAKNHALSQIIPIIPRYALETISFGGILLITLFILKEKDTIGHAMPLIALYAFAGYRLMPAFQQVFNGVARIRSNKAALDILWNDMKKMNVNDSNVYTIGSSKEILGEINTIQLHNITYQYPGANNPSITGLSLDIKSKSFVGFVGHTGSGKTTIVDILLGLLMPTNGELLINGILITSDNVSQWQRKIGYVPQNIFLSDNTVTNNIAFGVDSENINRKAVEQAARIANIDEFVKNSLPQGYDTLIGERGMRLSGGQRQRIGIARALYRNPSILILDEATSALDGETERAIIDAINQLAHNMTIIMIAHRITTVMECDVIHVLEKGRIVESGNYSELIQNSVRFQRLASIGLK